MRTEPLRSYRPWSAGNVAFVSLNDRIETVALVDGTPMGPLTPLGLGTAPGDEHDHPAISADGRTLYFEIKNGGSTEIFRATRAGPTGPFGAHEFVSIGGGASREAPYLLPNGTLYYAGDNGGLEAIHVVNPPPTAVDTGIGSLVPGLDDPAAKDQLPVVTPDELVIYFSSDRHQPDNEQIYTATRTSKDDAFGPPTRVVELTQAGTSNAPSWVSDDGCTLYFVSNRTGDTRLFRARRE
jgi:Tol biopolymer transport system component